MNSRKKTPARDSIRQMPRSRRRSREQRKPTVESLERRRLLSETVWLGTPQPVYGSNVQQTMVFPVTRIPDFSIPNDNLPALTVTYKTIDGSAVSGLDYTGTSDGTVTFAAGSTATSLDIPILAQSATTTAKTMTRTFLVELTGVPSTTADTATGTILDPIPALPTTGGRASQGANPSVIPAALAHPLIATTVSLSTTSGPIPEIGGAAVITASLSALSPVDVTLTLSFTGTATPGTNFVVSGVGYNSANQTLVIPAGSQTSQVTLTSMDDKMFGPPQISSIVTITGATNATPTGGPATIVFDEGDPGRQR